MSDQMSIEEDEQYKSKDVWTERAAKEVVDHLDDEYGYCLLLDDPEKEELVCRIAKIFKKAYIQEWR